MIRLRLQFLVALTDFQLLLFLVSGIQLLLHILQLMRILLDRIADILDPVIHIADHHVEFIQCIRTPFNCIDLFHRMLPLGRDGKFQSGCSCSNCAFFWQACSYAFCAMRYSVAFICIWLKPAAISSPKSTPVDCPNASSSSRI